MGAKFIKMITVIKGKKQVNISKEALTDFIVGYSFVHIDLGTGDGRYVFKKALENKDTFYIGVDPSRRQLEIYAKKANKAKLKNCLFVLGSIEMFPVELFGIATNVSIILPWGSLLGGIVQTNNDVINTIRALFVDAFFQGISDSVECRLDIIFGYSQNTEPKEVARLGLNHLNIEHISSVIVPAFENVGFTKSLVRDIKKDELFDFETTWSKKLTFGQDRPLFHLVFHYKPLIKA